MPPDPAALRDAIADARRLRRRREQVQAEPESEATETPVYVAFLGLPADGGPPHFAFDAELVEEAEAREMLRRAANDLGGAGNG